MNGFIFYIRREANKEYLDIVHSGHDMPLVILTKSDDDDEKKNLIERAIWIVDEFDKKVWDLDSKKEDDGKDDEKTDDDKDEEKTDDDKDDEKTDDEKEDDKDDDFTIDPLGPINEDL